VITTEFLVTSLIVVLVPGTGVVYTVSQSARVQSWLRYGFAAALAALGARLAASER